MRVTDRHRQSIGGIGPGNLTVGQKALDHRLHLFFVCVPNTDDGFFDPVRGVFGHRETLLGRCDQDRTPGQSEFEGRLRIFVYESFFDRCLLRVVSLKNAVYAVMQLNQAFGDRE